HLQEAFVPHRVDHLAADLATGGALEPAAVHVSILVLVNVDQFVSAEIDRIGGVRPAAVEKVRIKDLQRQRHPSPVDSPSNTREYGSPMQRYSFSMNGISSCVMASP